MKQLVKASYLSTVLFLPHINNPSISHVNLPNNPTAKTFTMSILPGRHSITHPKRTILSRLTHSSAITTLKSWLPPLNFITLHYLYFIVTLMITSVIFYCSSTPRWSITYTDSLFLVVSAMTESGLNTVNLSQMTTFQQALLFVLMLVSAGFCFF